MFSCLFALLAFIFQLIRDSVNPSNCYGQIAGWSSQLDVFFFTADVPAVLSALLLLALYQLEILRLKRLPRPVLRKLKIPAIVVIAGLFVLQIVVTTVVQAGADVSGGAVIFQTIVYLICFLCFLLFYSFTTLK